MSPGYSCCGRCCSRSGRASAFPGGCERARAPRPTAAAATSTRESAMTKTVVPLDVGAAEAHLMRFLSVEGITGFEADIAAAVSAALKAVGVPAEAIRFDDANARI